MARAVELVREVRGQAPAASVAILLRRNKYASYLLARLRSHGIPAIGPIGHGFCRSIYFAGPEGLTLEVSCQVAELDAAHWVDPKMLEDCGISSEEAQAMLNPPPCNAASPVAQPAFDPSVTNLAYPPEAIKHILATPDEAITRQGSYDEPPVTAPITV